jgi:hypothetical protein
VLNSERGQDFVRSVLPWEEMRCKEDNEMSHYVQKTLRTAVLRVSIIHIDFLLLYLI